MARVLLVDDDVDVLRSIEAQLRAGGHRALPVHAAAGVDVFEAIAALDFEVAITDMRMPEVDGFGVLAWIRANRPGVRVALLSAFAGDASATSGFDRLLDKPVRKAILLAAVEELAASRGGR